MVLKPPFDPSDSKARAKLAMDNADRFFGVDDDDDPVEVSGNGLPHERWPLIRYCVPLCCQCRVPLV